MIHTTCSIKCTSILFAEKLLLILLCETYVQSLCVQSDTQAVVIILNAVYAMKLTLMTCKCRNEALERHCFRQSADAN
jgi:hypothetical protein